jgi:hypothetical protein
MVGAAGAVLIVISVAAEGGLRQVVMSVTCTVKLPAVLTLIVCVVSPVDHNQLLPADEVRSTESPGQRSVGPEGVMVGAAGGVLTLVMAGVEGVLMQVVASVT